MTRESVVSARKSRPLAAAGRIAAAPLAETRAEFGQIYDRRPGGFGGAPTGLRGQARIFVSSCEK
jgi:hypothetical protein